LYQLGEIDDEYLQRELKPLQGERERLEAILTNTKSTGLNQPISSVELERLCAQVHEWVNKRGKEELPMLTEALQCP
jgi:hypothetical protein